MLPPRIDTSRLKHPVIAKLSCPVSLSVDVAGYPRPTVRWYIGRREVHSGDDGCRVSVEGRQHVLHVEEATDDLGRGVTVIAANSVGVATSDIPVKIYKVLRSQSVLQRSISQTLRSPDSVVLQRRRKLRLIRPGQSLSSFGSFSSFNYEYNVSRNSSERPRRPSIADSFASDVSGHWPPPCSPRHGRRSFEVQHLPSSPLSGRRYDPDVSFECIQEPSERTIGRRRRFISDSVFDDVTARAPIATTREVHSPDLSPTASDRGSPARTRPLRSKPPPAPPARSSSLVSSPSSPSPPLSSPSSPLSTLPPLSPSTRRTPRPASSPSPRRVTNGIPAEGIVNPAFHTSVSLEKQVSEFFAPSATMESDGEVNNDDIWKLMGFRLSELCRVLLKEPEEGAGEEEPETEEREVKPLSTKAADAEPIRERQRNDAAGRKPDGILIEGGSNGFVDGQHNSSNVNGCVISTSSGKKQKGTELPKKKGKKHKKGKQSPQRELPSESASQKPNEQKMLREQIDDATVSSGDLARPTTIELTTTYEATEQDDIMFSRGVIEMSAGADDGGPDLLNGYNQTHRAEVKRTTNGDVPGFCSRREVDEILQHKKDVDVYVREIERQHYLSYGGAAPAASDANSSDAIITDDSLVKEHSDTTNDDADVCNGGSTIATIVTVTADDVAPITDHDNDHNPGSLSDTYSDPVRRSTRTKKGKLRHIVELNRSPPEVSIDQHHVEPSPPCDESCDVPCDESGDESCDEHQVVEIQVVPACRGRTDIQALIASTEAINVDALFDDSLQDCLASMTISYSDSSLNGTHYDTEAAATNGLLPGTQRIDSETVKKNIEDVEECSSPVQYDDDVASDNQGDIDNVSRHDTAADNTLSTGQLDPEVGTIAGETDVNKVGSAADHDSETDVVTRHSLEDNDTRRPSESFSDDILFDEGFRVDDAWDFEMDAVSDEISLGSFNTVIAVEAMNIDTDQAGVMTANERFNDAVESVAIDNNVMVSTFEAANMTMGTSDAVTDSNVGMTANISLDRVCCVRMGGHALPQSERSESFEYKESSPVLEHYRSSSEESDRFSHSHSIERCESFECEVRKQLQHPGVTSGNQRSEALETDDVSGFVVVSSEPSIPTEVELRIVEPGDDDDDDTVASRCRETHARQFTMENTSDDFALANSCDNGDTHSGHNEKSGASADDNSIDFETVHVREKTARALFDDVIMFNESGGKSRRRSDSGERRGKTVEEECDNVAESTNVIVANGDNNNDVITDEGNVSREVTVGEIRGNPGDVPFTSEAERVIRDACVYGTMLPFGEGDPTIQGRPLPHMNTPIIVITDYCDPTSYTVGLDDCETRDCDTYVDETETGDCDTRVGETESPTEPPNGKYGEMRHVANTEGDIANVTADTQTYTLNESHDTESSISRDFASANATSSENVASDNWGSDAADVVRRRFAGVSSAAAATASPLGATAVASTSRQTARERTNLPDDVTVPRRPETSAVDPHRQEFLSDLLVEKACLEGFFSNIGSLLFLLLTLIIFHLMDMFSRKYT